MPFLTITLYPFPYYKVEISTKIRNYWQEKEENRIGCGDYPSKVNESRKTLDFNWSMLLV